LGAITPVPEKEAREGASRGIIEIREEKEIVNPPRDSLPPAQRRPQRSHVPRLGDWLKTFLTSIGHSKTKSRYQSSVNNILRFFGPKIRLLEITPEQAFEFQQKRLSEGVGKAIVNRDFATLSSALTKARKLRLITHNPCVDVGKLNERRERR
jgi:hypothetical protein